jgi:hypothetical protein
MLEMQNENLTVSVFKSHEDAEAAVKTLERSGFDLKRISIVGRDYHTEENVVGYYNASDRIKYWGKNGAFWGAIWGWLFGSAFFFIPGLGPILIAGPLVAGVVGALEGAVVVGGLSALGAGLYSIGIPRNSVLDYETALRSDQYLLLIHGTAEEVARGKEVLQSESAAMRTDVHIHEVAATAAHA